MATQIASQTDFSSTKLAIRQRFKQTYPAYAESFGGECLGFRTNLGLIVKGWRIQDGSDLHITSTRISQALQLLISGKHEYWQKRRPHNDPSCVNPPYTLQTFLLGVDTAHASPHVVVVCNTEWFGNCIRRIILESNILLAHQDWGCFKLPVGVRMTAANDFSGLGLEEDVEEMNNVGSREFEIYLSGDSDAPIVAGVMIEVWENGHLIGKSTIGGFVFIGGKIFGLTVAHVFFHQYYRYSAEETFDVDESELNIFEDEVESLQTVNEEEVKDQSFSCHVSRLPCLERRFEDLESLLVDEVAPQDQQRKPVGRLHHLSNVHCKDTPSYTKLDWALVHFNRPVSFEERKLKNLRPSQKAVTISTSSNEFSASFVSHALFGMPMVSVPLPVLVAHSDTRQREGMKVGDSGSWALHAENGKPAGMIIGDSIALQEFYLLDMDDVLNDIRTQTGQQAVVATSSDLRQIDRKALNWAFEEHREPKDQQSYSWPIILQGIQLLTAPSVFSVLWALSDFRRITLRDKLVSNLVGSQFDQKLFLPDACISKLITAQSVMVELQRNRLPLSAELVEHILRKAPKAFSTLVYSNMTEVITAFQRIGLTDNDLPLTLTNSTPDTSNDSAFNDAIEEYSRGIKTRQMANNRFSSFSECQWLFMAPVFRQRQFSYHLHDDEILPFIEVEKGTRIDFWRCGQPYKVKIHSDHSPISDEGTLVLAIEDHDRQYSEICLQESEKLWSKDHPQILNPLAVITRSSVHYIVFPWANGGTLREFWENRQEIPDLIITASVARDMIEQIVGLVDAAMHLNGRHADLKPENILWFSERQGIGRLKIADFGLGTARERPELPSDDIWNLGFVFIEYITWFLLGYDGLNHLGLDHLNASIPHDATWIAAGDTRNHEEPLNSTIESGIMWLQQQDIRLQPGSALGDVLVTVQDQLSRRGLDRTAVRHLQEQKLVAISEWATRLREILEKARVYPEYILGPLRPQNDSHSIGSDP